MFGRIFLFIITIISLGWLGYATFDRVNQSKVFRPEYIFSAEDQELLILQNAEQQATIFAQFEGNQESIQQLLAELNYPLIQKIYVSKTRAHILIETKNELDENTLRTIGTNAQQWKIKGKEIQIGNLKGNYINNLIYLSEKEYKLNEEPWEAIHYDKNADASVIQFDQHLPTVQDIYVKAHGILEYKLSLNKDLVGTKVNDKVVFSAAIPASVSSYEFYETDYLRFKDPTILESPMNNWLKYGLVKININNQEAIITDFIEGQDPIQVLYDHFQLESKDAENDYFKGQISNLIQDQQGFYVYEMDDFVVISGNRAVCETIIGDYKLGNTLAQNQEKSVTIYDLLPQKVNYRKVNKTERLAASIHESTLLTTVVGGAGEVKNTISVASKTTPTSYVAGNVKDIHLITENSFFVSTNDKKISFFENDKKKWEVTIEGEIVGTPEIIDLYANNKSQLLVSTDKKVHVIDINGQEPSGFPIGLEEQVNVQSPLFYRWKGNGFFILAGEKGRLLQYDNQGRELNMIRTKLNQIDLKPVVWVSANKPFVGVLGDNMFEMIQLDSRKSFRTFNASNVQTIVKLPNEIKLFSVQQNQLMAYDQRGGISKFDKFLSGALLNTLSPEKGIVVKDQQKIKLFNSSGLEWGSILLPFTDVSEIQLFTTNSGSTFLSAIDGLENKVYLYKSNGELFTKKQFDGSKIVRFHNDYIFTVIDNLVVKYSLK